MYYPITNVCESPNESKNSSLVNRPTNQIAPLVTLKSTVVDKFLRRIFDVFQFQHIISHYYQSLTEFQEDMHLLTFDDILLVNL